MTKRVQLFISLLLTCTLVISNSHLLTAQDIPVTTFKNVDQNATLITGIVLDSESQTIEAFGKRYLGEYTWGKRSLTKVFSTRNATTYKVVYTQGMAQHTLYVTQKHYSNEIQVISETQYEGDRPEYANVRNFELTRIPYQRSQLSSTYDGVGAANK